MSEDKVRFECSSRDVPHAYPRAIAYPKMGFSLGPNKRRFIGAWAGYLDQDDQPSACACKG